MVFVVLETPTPILVKHGVKKNENSFRNGKADYLLGVVENMNSFACPHCGHSVDVFGHGEGQKVADTYGVPLLGQIAIDPRIRVGGDTGAPVASLGEDAPGARSIYAMARAVAARVTEVSATPTGPRVEIV